MRVRMSLDKDTVGSYLNIKKINDIDLKSYLIRFGIDNGNMVQCFHKISNGPVVIKFNRQEIALGSSLAKNIIVSVN
jgi:Fe2+ transport system protein FeoA